MENMNAILTIGIAMAGALAGALWASPRGCRWLSLRLYCRAEALEASRRTYRETLAANAAWEEAA